MCRAVFVLLFIVLISGCAESKLVSHLPQKQVSIVERGPIDVATVTKVTFDNARAGTSMSITDANLLRMMVDLVNSRDVTASIPAYVGEELENGVLFFIFNHNIDRRSFNVWFGDGTMPGVIQDGTITVEQVEWLKGALLE